MNYFKKKIIFSIYKGYKVLKKKKLTNNYYQFELDIENYINSLNDKKTISNTTFIYQQYCYRSLLSGRLKIFYLFFLSINCKLIFPYPSNWNFFLKKNNINSYYKLSNILFFILSIFLLFKNFFNIFFNIINNANKNYCNSNYNVIVNLNDINCLPTIKNIGYNIFDSLIDEFNLSGTILHNLNSDKIYHKNCHIQFLKDFFPLSFQEKIFLIILLIFQLFKSLFHLILLNTQYAVLFKEIIFNQKVKIFSRNNYLAKNYFFLFNSGNYRPMWTYYAESKKSNINLINTASGFYAFKDMITKDYPIQISFGLKCSNWPNYYVDKKEYFCFLKTTIADKNFKLLNKRIQTSDNGAQLPFLDNTKFTIGIFDITPIRKFLRLLYLPQDNFRTSEICIKFLKDIEDVLSSFEVNILFKKKRSKLDRDCKRYTYIVNKINFINIDPSISSTRFSEVCDLIISVPFTTAAFNLNKHGKMNSIFYSPVDLISKDDRAAQNLKIVIGKKDLANFISNQITFKK